MTRAEAIRILRRKLNKDHQIVKRYELKQGTAAGELRAALAALDSLDVDVGTDVQPVLFVDDAQLWGIE